MSALASRHAGARSRVPAAVVAAIVAAWALAMAAEATGTAERSTMTR